MIYHICYSSFINLNALSFAMNVVVGRYRTFNVFQPMDTLFYRFEWWYPLWFVHWMDTLDDLISNEYSLWFIFELDSFNGSRIGGWETWMTS